MSYAQPKLSERQVAELLLDAAAGGTTGKAYMALTDMVYKSELVLTAAMIPIGCLVCLVLVSVSMILGASPWIGLAVGACAMYVCAEQVTRKDVDEHRQISHHIYARFSDKK